MNKIARTSQGLTLIEVLVALAIVSIALTAIIKAVSQNIRTTSHLQEKTIALWVGQYVMSEVQLSLMTLPKSDMLTAKTEMLGKDWHWQVKEVGTASARTKKIAVAVYAHEIDEEASPAVVLEGYVYAE